MRRWAGHGPASGLPVLGCGMRHAGHMVDPFASGADFALGKLFDHGVRAIDNAKLPGVIAKDVRERAGRRDVDFLEKQLADALRDGHVRSLLQRGDAEDITSARAKLRAVELYSQLSEGEAFEVFFAAVERALREHTDLAVLVADVQDEARARELRSRDSDARRDKFEENLAGFPYPFREDLREIDRGGGSVAVRLAAELVAPASRNSRLLEWATVLPSWLPEDDSRVLGWLAELSTTAGLSRAAQRWIGRALDAGATPRAYWKYLFASNEKPVTDESVRSALADVPDHPLTLAVLSGGVLSERIQAAGGWPPETETQAAVRDVILVALLAREGQVDAAVELGLEALDERANFRAGLIAGDYLIHRAVSENLTTHAADVRRAIDVGLSIRDSTRAFGIASFEAVELAVKGSAILGDFQTALSLTQAAPDGEATESEAEARGVVEAAIRVLLNIGDVGRAERLAGEGTRSHTTALVAAAAALRLEDNDAAIEHFRVAFESTDDDQEQAEVCFHLAQLGVEHEWVQVLEERNSVFARDVRLIAQLYQGAPRSEAKAKTRALEDRRIASEYARYLRLRGRHRDAGDSFGRLGTKWNSRDDHFNAALCYLDVPDLAAALRAIGGAVLGDARWPLLAQALRLQAQVATQLLDYDTAVSAARQLRDLDPANDDDRWLQIRVFYQAGAVAEATTALRGKDDLAMPRSPEEAIVWLAIYRQQGAAMASVDVLRDVALQFQTSADVKLMAISCVLHAPGEISTPEVNIASLHHDFESHEIGSSPLQVVDLEGLSGREMLEKMEEVSGGARDTTKLDALIQAGTLPLGAVAGFTKRNMAETLVEMPRTPRFTSSPNEAPYRASIPAEHERVVIDLTAVTTLARLPEEYRDVLAYRYALQTHLIQFRDCLVSAEALGVQSVGRVLPSTVTRPVMFAELSQEDHRIRRQTITAMVDLMRSTNRAALSGRPLPPGDFPEELLGETWTLAGETAVDLGLALWCDDRTTREALASRGVTSFSTLELIASIESSGDLSATDTDLLRSLLLDQWIVDVPFHEGVYQTAIDLGQGQPGGSAAALEASGPESAIRKLEFYIGVTEQVCEDPDKLGAWADSAARYADSLSQDVDVLRRTLGFLFANWLGASWIDQSSLQIVTTSIRRNSPVQMTEVIDDVFPPIYAEFAKVYEPAVAFPYMRQRVSLLQDDEQQAILWLMLRTKHEFVPRHQK